jgi:hypothetical protein
VCQYLNSYPTIVQQWINNKNFNSLQHLDDTLRQVDITHSYIFHFDEVDAIEPTETQQQKLLIEEKLQVFSPNCKLLFKFGSKGSENGQFRSPHGLALSNCGQYLLVCDKINHCIQVFNSMNGAFVKGYGSKGSDDGQFDNPSGICISPTGKIIVVEDHHSSQHRVQIFE